MSLILIHMSLGSMSLVDIKKSLGRCVKFKHQEPYLLKDRLARDSQGGGGTHPGFRYQLAQVL